MSGKRILCFGISHVMGGVEQVVKGLYPYLLDAGYSLDFVCFFPEIAAADYWAAHGSHVYFLPKRSNGPKAYEEALRTFFSDHGKDYDLVWYNCSSLSNVTVLKLARQAGIPRIVLHSHGSTFESSNRLIYLANSVLHKHNRRKVQELGDIFLACSTPAGKFLYGDKVDFQVLPNGIEVEKFAFDRASRVALRQELQLPEDAFVLGTVGRLTAVKNQAFLLHVFHDFHALHREGHLLFIGAGEDLQALQSLAAELGLTDSCHFVGFQTDIPAWLSVMDVLCLPSYSEGYPLTVVEAQANNLPVIMSDTITQEVIFNDLVKPLSIQDGTKMWVQSLEDSAGATMKRNRSIPPAENITTYASLAHMAQTLINYFEE